MDQGLENYVLIQWFTEKNWWGNDLFADKYKQVGSDFEEVARGAATASALVRVQSAGRVALQDMIDTKLAKDTIVLARNPQGSRVDVGVLVEPPGKDIFALTATQHGANWIAQKENPAYERLD
jgi:phage gp46-like protein